MVYSTLSSTIFSSTPRQKVVFFPFTYRFREVTEEDNDEKLMATTRVDVTFSVVNLVYTKSKSDASGTFSMQLTPDQNWTQILKPGDWGLIYMSQFNINPDIDDTEGLQALVNIDRVSRQKSIAPDGTKSITYRVNGRDFGKIFEKSRFYYNPYIPQELQNNLVILKSGFKIMGSPESFIRSYLSLYFGDGFLITGQPSGFLEDPLNQEVKKQLERLDQIKIPPAVFEVFLPGGGGNLGKLLQVEIGQDVLKPEGYSTYIPADRAINNSLWDILKSVSNPLMNEIFLSMKYYPEQNKVLPTLTLRKLPFTGHHLRQIEFFPVSVYTALNSLNVSEDMIVADDIGYNDHERYSWINFDPTTPLVTGYPQFMGASFKTRFDSYIGSDVPLFPYVNKMNIKRYGFTELEAKTEFAWVEYKKNAKNELALDLAERWMREVIEWWGEYERYMSGTLILKGFHQGTVIQVGNKLTTSGAPENIVEPNSSRGKSQESTSYKTVLKDHINIGDNLYFLERNHLMHIEAFSQTWNAPGNSEIQLTVTRGVVVDPNNPIGGSYKFLDEVEPKKQTDIGLTVQMRESTWPAAPPAAPTNIKAK